MSRPRILQRLGCIIGRHQWSRWQYYRSDAANGWALYKHRRCVLCGRYQDDVLTRIEDDYVCQCNNHPPSWGVTHES